ncbi:MAG: NAD(P)/FAD-dependent oxidoreductase [Bacteroidia bacterium]
MGEKVQIQLRPGLQEDESAIRRATARQLNIAEDRLQTLVVRRRNIDARKRPIYVLQVEAWVDEAAEPETPWEIPLKDVSNAKPVHIVGLGPAGLFAALRCIEQGLKPVVIERGKAVRPRRRDLAALNRDGEVNPESNYCFGEGGAGTFSDGKLYTRSKKRGNLQRVLDILVQFGASPDILVEAHPHIGTNKLPAIIEAMREAIIEHGGEVRFNTKLTDLRLTSDTLSHIQTNGDTWEEIDALILATGHSARDIFELLHRHKIDIEAKPFALGLRVEHPQAVIDSIQYSCGPLRPDGLPAAAYNLVKQIEDRGVYSFCMCPGGIICPASTSNDEVVVNGWSPSKRNTGYANSGIVVEVPLASLNRSDDPLTAMRFQQMVEQKAFKAGGGKQQAPATRMTDFLSGKISGSLPECSYLPGIVPADLRQVLPKQVYRRLQGGFKAFGQRMKGYITSEAVVVGVESRTSSPVRIPRDHKSLMHPQVKGLFPCGEGAGYAGGIVSAAMDGERCAVGVGVMYNG